MFTKMRLLFLTLSSLILSACVSNGREFSGDLDFDRSLRFDETRALAKSTLNKIQTPSIRENREYCGFVGQNAAGDMAVPEIFKGTASSCTIEFPTEPGWVLTASIHTHAGYDPAFNSEFPSTTDVEADMDGGTHGYVSTPGGRFWFVNGNTGVVTAVCGPGCLTQDPRFRDEPGGSDPAIP